MEGYLVQQITIILFFLMIRAFPFKHTVPPKDPYGSIGSIDEQELFNLLSLGLYHNDLHFFSFRPLFFIFGFQGGSYNKPAQTPLPGCGDVYSNEIALINNNLYI